MSGRRGYELQGELDGGTHKNASHSRWTVCTVLSGVSIAVTALFGFARRWRGKLMPRRDPRLPYEELVATTSDGVDIAVRHIHGCGEGAIILAHPAVTGQRYTPLVDFAERLAGRFEVYTFDFRGHGGSGGTLELHLTGPLEDMRCVIDMVRGNGHRWVGAAGFSMGGMAAFLHAATYGKLDAVVTVGAPPMLPDIERYRKILPAWSLFLRFLGARFRASGGGGPLPIEAAEAFPDIPLLVVHGEDEVFYAREDLDIMLERLGGKAELWVIEGAGHTELAGREDAIAAWLAALCPRETT